MTHVDTAGTLLVRPAAGAGVGSPAGAVPGPRTVAQVLEHCRSVDVLSRRAVPGRRAVLDWLVVSRSAVYLVDEYETGSPRPTVRARQGGARAVDDSWVVVVDGVEQPGVLPALRSRARVVRDVLTDAGWGQGGLVVPVVCVDGGGLPSMRRQLRLGSCLVVGSSGLGRLVRSGGAMGADARSRITRVLLEAFPAAAPAVG